MSVMRRTVLSLSLFLVAVVSPLAAEEPHAPSGKKACASGAPSSLMEQILASESGTSAQSTPASRPASQRKWMTTAAAECPPPDLVCFYYATGDCLPCGRGRNSLCESYKCAPDGALYTCCTCGLDVC
jgi:hypothetical protein